MRAIAIVFFATLISLDASVSFAIKNCMGPFRPGGRPTQIFKLSSELLMAVQQAEPGEIVRGMIKLKDPDPETVASLLLMGVNVSPGRGGMWPYNGPVESVLEASTLDNVAALTLTETLTQPVQPPTAVSRTRTVSSAAPNEELADIQKMSAELLLAVKNAKPGEILQGHLGISKRMTTRENVAATGLVLQRTIVGSVCAFSGSVSQIIAASRLEGVTFITHGDEYTRTGPPPILLGEPNH